MNRPQGVEWCSWFGVDGIIGDGESFALRSGNLFLALGLGGGEGPVGPVRHWAGATGREEPGRKVGLMTRSIVVAQLAGALAIACGVLSACAVEERPLSAPDDAYTDRLHQSFDNGVYESQYHLFAEGIDRSRPVGLLVFVDGSGGYGFSHPDSTYQLDSGGEDGLVALARRHNLVLLTPIAPPPGCDYEGNVRPSKGEDANCWYDPENAEGKAAWSSDLVDKVSDEFDFDSDRIVVGGFSSGAQWATQYWAPAHGENHSVDLTVAIGYGGAPIAEPEFSEEYKADTAFAWDTGTADHAYRTDMYGSVGGYDWYTEHGFETRATWPEGVEHDRPEEFHLIMDREITRVLGTPAT